VSAGRLTLVWHAAPVRHEGRCIGRNDMHFALSAEESLRPLTTWPPTPHDHGSSQVSCGVPLIRRAYSPAFGASLRRWFSPTDRPAGSARTRDRLPVGCERATAPAHGLGVAQCGGRILERECGAYCERAGREARPVKTRPSRYHGQRTWPPIPSPMQAQRFTISDRYPWPLSILDKGQT